MNEKLCVFCKHFNWDGFHIQSYGTYTGSCLEGGLSCKKGHYIEECPYDNDSFRKLILRAESCGDYAPEALSK